VWVGIALAAKLSTVGPVALGTAGIAFAVHTAVGASAIVRALISVARHSAVNANASCPALTALALICTVLPNAFLAALLCLARPGTVVGNAAHSALFANAVFCASSEGAAHGALELIFGRAAAVGRRELEAHGGCDDGKRQFGEHHDMSVVGDDAEEVEGSRKRRGRAQKRSCLSVNASGHGQYTWEISRALRANSFESKNNSSSKCVFL
jgi:hypothetical protein